MFETVKKVLAAQLEDDPELITADTDIMDDLGADSLDLVELVMSLEEHYDMAVMSKELAEICITCPIPFEY